MPTAKSLYRLAAGTFTALCVGMQYWLGVLSRPDVDVLGSSIRFLSFFTILTNVLIAVALLLPVLAPGTRLGRFFDRPGVRTALTGYIIMVGVVYFLLLRNLSQHVGWPLFFEHMLHYVTPPLFVLDWLLFVDKGNLDWRPGLGALSYPALYIAWTLVHGALSGWYPYPFIDVPDLGYPRALTNMAGLVVAFFGLELALVGVGRLIRRTSPESSSLGHHFQ
jgi:hypothetical protein